ncbi:MAG: hypothetical protein V3V99_11040 [candidate division Zixibacteria bacterium]
MIKTPDHPNQVFFTSRTEMVASEELVKIYFPVALVAMYGTMTCVTHCIMTSFTGVSF